MWVGGQDLDGGSFDTFERYTFGEESGFCFTEERREFHLEILKELCPGYPDGPKTIDEDPHVLLMAGPPGAGKSTYFAKELKEDYDGVVYLDPDLIKEMIPEYEIFKKTDPEHAAALVHEESSYLKDEIVHYLLKNRISFVLDTTLSGESKSIGLIKLLLENGYNVFVQGVVRSLGSCQTSVRERAKSSGRIVPPSVVAEIHDAFYRTWAMLPEHPALSHALVDLDRATTA